jgi:hypothetical protein
VVRLICTLREFYQSISFILIGQFEIIDNSYWFIFWTDSDLFAVGISVLENCEIHAKQSFIFPHMKVSHSWENYFTMSSIYMYAADFTRRFNGL